VRAARGNRKPEDTKGKAIHHLAFACRRASVWTVARFAQTSSPIIRKMNRQPMSPFEVGLLSVGKTHYNLRAFRHQRPVWSNLRLIRLGYTGIT
jgi:hypothetical protein